MGLNVFPQNVIAIIWDFDKTLTPDYMQVPLFKHFNVNESQFWNESNGLEKYYKDRGTKNVSRDALYLNHILTYVRNGIFKGLSNKKLLELGKEIQFYDGLPEFLSSLKQTVAQNELFAKYSVTVEHYIVSTGLRQMIMGSRIAPYVDGVWGCEFVAGPIDSLSLSQPELPLNASDQVITDIAYSIDNTSKTRALFEINKGANKHSEIEVNATLAAENRRVPFHNMIYIADGPSDVPAFSIVNQYKGRTFAVYAPQNRKQFDQVNRLQRENRVQGIGEASYVEGSLTTFWLRNAVEEIATRIVDAKQAALREEVGTTPQHIITESTIATNKAAKSKQTTSEAEAAQVAEKKPPAYEPIPISIRTASEK
jgi:hypothetical protein